jgi:hypothetical protein
MRILANIITGFLVLLVIFVTLFFAVFIYVGYNGGLTGIIDAAAVLALGFGGLYMGLNWVHRAVCEVLESVTARRDDTEDFM